MATNKKETPFLQGVSHMENTRGNGHKSHQGRFQFYDSLNADQWCCLSGHDLQISWQKTGNTVCASSSFGLWQLRILMHQMTFALLAWWGKKLPFLLFLFLTFNAFCTDECIHVRDVKRLIPIFIHTWHLAYITTLFLNKQTLLLIHYLIINKESQDFHNMSQLM